MRKGPASIATPGSIVRRSASTPASMRPRCQAEGEACAVHRGVRPVESLGEGTDVVLVTVGEHDGVHPARAEALVVGNHPLDAVVPFGEHLACVDEQTILARLKEKRVHAELAQSPNRGDSEIGVQGVLV